MGTVVHDTQELKLFDTYSMAADALSAVMDVRFFDMGSIQCVWSGANASTARFVPQASNDGVNWCDLISESQSKRAIDAAGCCLYVFSNFEFEYLRLSLIAKTNTAGTLTVFAFAKRRRHPGS